MFKEVSSKVNFSTLEEQILEFWDENEIFEKSIQQRPESQTYFFYDGPPFATGLPHYGHLLAGTIKDVVPRYQTMQGKRVERRFGWDCHGLPVEFEVEKELGLKGKADIEEMGISAFNEKCRSIVMRYSTEWKNTVRRMGRWVDLENDYKTMDTDFMESIWWVFKTLWDKDLIYKSGKIVPYSARLSTPLSNFEANLDYRDVQDPSVTVKFKVIEEENTYILAWTTTPWTLPSNLALTVSPDTKYLKVEYQDEFYYVAEPLLEANFPSVGKEEEGEGEEGEEGEGEKKEEEEKKASVRIISEHLGSELEATRYEPLFPYFTNLKAEGAYRVVLGDYVTTDTGTGIVHTAPMFGEDDYKTGQKYGLPTLLPMNDKGEFLDSVEDFKGMWFKDADKSIIKHLKDQGQIFKHETCQHSYPYCWRSGTPLMYRSIDSWFVNVEKIKELMLANNKKISWKPSHIQDGRMGKWLEGARDWAISRNRYWGTPLPVWVCPECDHNLCLGSRQDLEDLSGAEINDLHRHYIDQLTFTCPECSHPEMKRTTEVLDCWFESGSMPYGQNHYPFENKEKFENAFPADFISEGLDQTRGWFYTLSVLGSALFEKPAFQNCIVSGMLLAEDGKKMSKSLKNYPDPMHMVNKYGADAIRLYMLNSGAIRAEELRFAEHGLQETLRGTMIPLWNSLSFFTSYANIDKWTPEKLVPPQKMESPLDRWIFSQLHHLIEDVTDGMDEYDLNRSVQPFVGFIDMLTNWYIRRSRRRFWKADKGNDKQQAYSTLYTLLVELSKVIAPFIPFLAESTYRTLRTKGMPQSVHLCDFPVADSGLMDKELDAEMDIILKTVNMGRALRARQQIKIRQPLASITLVTKNEAVQGILGEMDDLIKDELNIKEVLIAEHEEELVTLSTKANLKVLGPKLGKKLKIIRPMIEAFNATEVDRIQEGGLIELEAGGETFSIGFNEILIHREEKEGLVVENSGDLTVALDAHLTSDLLAEGYAREFVNKVQQTRKEREFTLTDRVEIAFNGTEELKQALIQHADYIKTETLADSLAFSKVSEDSFVEWEINNLSCSIGVQKIR